MGTIFKPIAAALVGIAILFGASSAASAQTNYTQSGFYYGYQNSNDCTVYAALPTAGNPTGWGTVPCGQRHAATYVMVTLNITTPTGVVASSTGWIGPSSNSFGNSHWYVTKTFSCNPNHRYQTVSQGWVDGVQFYSTTGSPKKLC